MSEMNDVDTVVIGAGQAGLATSYHLAAQGRDHIVLDRGRVADRWLTERWDSLRLLTPNWMNDLPGWDYSGPEPDGYVTAGAFAECLARYAAHFDAPVLEGQNVQAVEPVDGGYRIRTGNATFRAASVVVTTGYCDVPAVPTQARHLPPGLHQVTTATYARPGDIPDGGVLVIGASASGVQIADELRRAGREVVLAVGRHIRLPRTYRGMDIMWWLHTLGMLDRSIDDVADRAAALRGPSLQLVGRPGPESLDLRVLSERGVVLAGRLMAVEGTEAGFADDLTTTTGLADARLQGTLASIDAAVRTRRLGSEVLDPDPPPAFRPGASPSRLDLAAEGITSVVWATGFRRAYLWLHVPVLDGSGEISQRAGITTAPGLYTVGQRFQTRRNSTFIGGVGHDAAAVAAHINALRPRLRTRILSRSHP
jgi:putative flavoprotein involved in K+ transport